MTFNKLMSFTAISGLVFCGLLTIQPAHSQEQVASAPPALIVTNDPLPMKVTSNLYKSPSRVSAILPEQMSGQYFNDGKTTVVGKKVENLRAELFNLQGNVAELAEQLAAIEENGHGLAAEYYSSVATIQTQLQSGTTPGNPRLVQRLSVARNNLETLNTNISSLNNLAVEISNAASVSAFLLESTRATYGLSGAIEEDHVNLAKVEDSLNNTIVLIDRLLNNVNDDITRVTAYLNAERDNLRAMALAINSGSVFGRSLATSTYNQSSTFQSAGVAQGTNAASIQKAVLTNPKPLVKIRFNEPNVSYEQPVYSAVNEALNMYPDARFDVIAVHPEQGNAAQVAIEATKARRNAERVLRSLTEMGLPLNKVNLSYAKSADARSSEVHIYIY